MEKNNILTCALVFVYDKQQTSLDLLIQELTALAQAAHFSVITHFVQPKTALNPATFIGKGKVNEISEYVTHHSIDYLIFNDELNGSHIRNLQAQIDCQIIDRSELILTIFKLRAYSNLGKLQVTLAALKYQLPRLIASDNMSRIVGGMKTRGPGEQQLELDRRHLLKEIKKIEHKIAQSLKTQHVNQRQRLKHQLPLIALVGYTNAGKSTLFNQLLALSNNHKTVAVKDALFASLDTAVRAIKLDANQDGLLIDTVGFISNLPTHLVAAFQSTLAEVQTADIIIHVINAASPLVLQQVTTTQTILQELQVYNKPVINVFNKIDQVTELPIIPDLKGTLNLFISALNRDDVVDLRQTIVTYIENNTEIKKI